MKHISINNKSIDSRKRLSGQFQEIILLTEKDLCVKKLDLMFMGMGVDLVLTPRKLTDDEFKVISPSLYDGATRLGKVVIYE